MYPVNGAGGSDIGNAVPRPPPGLQKLSFGD